MDFAPVRGGMLLGGAFMLVARKKAMAFNGRLSAVFHPGPGDIGPFGKP